MVSFFLFFFEQVFQLFLMTVVLRIPLIANHDHENSKAFIHSISFIGVDPGGAPECSQCKPGTAPNRDK